MRRPSVTPSFVISLLALFVALSSGAYAATGGNFILGQANTANQSTTLTGSPATGPALTVSNTTSGQPAAAFIVQGKKAPFTVSSIGRVPKLNADLLDGLDSTGFLAASGKAADSDRLDGLDSAQLQRRVTGSCAAGSAIASIDVAGTTSCASFPHGLAWAGRAVGPFSQPGDIGAFHTNGGQLLISFDASGYRASLGWMSVYLVFCTSTPCDVGNSLGYLAQAQGYTNEGSSHRALVTAYATDTLAAGFYYLNVFPADGAVMDGSDIASWSIVEL